MTPEAFPPTAAFCSIFRRVGRHCARSLWPQETIKASTMTPSTKPRSTTLSLLKRVPKAVFSRRQTKMKKLKTHRSNHPETTLAGQRIRKHCLTPRHHLEKDSTGPAPTQRSANKIVLLSPGAQRKKSHCNKKGNFSTFRRKRERCPSQAAASSLTMGAESSTLSAAAPYGTRARPCRQEAVGALA